MVGKQNSGLFPALAAGALVLSGCSGTGAVGGPPLPTSVVTPVITTPAPGGGSQTGGGYVPVPGGNSTPNTFTAGAAIMVGRWGGYVHHIINNTGARVPARLGIGNEPFPSYSADISRPWAWRALGLSGATPQPCVIDTWNGYRDIRCSEGVVGSHGGVQDANGYWIALDKPWADYYTGQGVKIVGDQSAVGVADTRVEIATF